MKILLKTLLFGIFLFFINGFWHLSVFGQTAKTSKTNNGKNQSVQKKKVFSSKKSVPFSDEEYKIYSTVLKDEKGILIIKDKTGMDADSKNFKGLENRGFENFLRKINSETIKDFLNKNNKSVSLERKFSLDLDYQFITNEELKKTFDYKIDGEMNWTFFREKYPKAGNIYTLSRVGFSQDGSQALVFVTDWCRSLCGEGNYYILKKENYEWKIVEQMMSWIS